MMRRRLDEPAMSDKTLLISVEDLINRALGPVNCNVVHFKLIQTILHILARQMRLLEQLVEIKMSDLGDMEEEREKEKRERKDVSPTKGKSKKTKDKSEKGDKTDKADVDPEKDAKDKAAKEEKDRAKEEKAAAKAKEKADKAADKAAEKAPAKAAEPERSRDKSRGRVGSQTNVSVKVRRESIAVVTRSEFDMVAKMVDDLRKRAGPLPSPAMPSNKKLRSDIAKGSASLTDTMEAMQLAARVRAAEQAVEQMGDMLTQLALMGALPREVAQHLQELQPASEAAMPRRKTSASGVSHKSVAIDPTLAEEAGAGGRGAPSRYSMASQSSASRSFASRLSVVGLPGVTHPELDVAIETLKEDLMKQAVNMTNKANAVAENAGRTAKAVSDKLAVATELNNRITTLNGLVRDYAVQLSGMDEGLSTQMTSFRDQMTQIRTELEAGLAQLALVNNNAETAAVMELTERYDLLVTQLDHTLHQHGGLTTVQSQLGDELRSLVECVEMLREQKADRDEVLDGLRDKADNSRLAGLLTAQEFAAARAELEGRLALCHNKFDRQDNVWTSALKDLAAVTEEKAEVTQLLAARDSAEEKLREMQEMQRYLAVLLGEPKAALIMRALSKGAYCGSCLVPALMEPFDPLFGAPPALPALRPPTPPCTPAPIPAPPDHREHMCNRWVGGSHTLLSSAVTRTPCPPLPVLPRPPTSKYVGKGDDGRLYMMEEELQPCVECNQYLETVERGAGDQEVSKPVEDNK